MKLGFKEKFANGYGGDEEGSVFDLDGDDEVGIEVTIKDSLGAGVITGGYTFDGGGIRIHQGTTLYFEGGAIQNNKADRNGGGICI